MSDASRNGRRRALVTGGAGFIGSHLCDRLLGEGWEVYALDDLSTGSEDNVAHLMDRRDFHLVVESVLDEPVVNSLVNRCDVVWHLAAAVGVRLVVEKPVQTLITNVRGTEVVLDKCARFGKPVLVASTSEVYGDHRSLAPLTENAQRIYGPTTINRWGYAGSKAIDEFLALSFHAERALPVVIVRLFNTVGPRQTGRYGMVVPAFVQAALAEEPITVFGDGTQTRCFCHVADTVEAIVRLPRDPQVMGEIFNVGANAPIAIADLAEWVKEKTGSASKITYMDYQDAYGEGFEDMRHRVPSIDKITAAIGWRPERDLERILDDVIADRAGRALSET